jgi:hypothetical protein
MRKLVGGASGPLVAVILLSITPPLALSQVVHQAYAIVLSLATLLILLRLRENTFSKADVIVGYPLWLSGVVAHATYTIMILAFTIPLILINKSGEARSKIIRAVEFILIISLAYWLYTYVMDTIVRPTVNAFERLIDLITGRTTPFYGVRQPWYGPEQQMFFIAWALVPSVATSYILFSVLTVLSKITSPVMSSVGRIRLKGLLNGSDSTNMFLRLYVRVLGLFGLGGTVINFMLRTLPTFGGRYFYWLYLLMLPLSAFVVVKASKILAGLILCIILISMISFYGIQDPTLSANTYGEKIGWADRDSWNLALTLSQHLDPNIPAWIDPRLYTPLSSLKPSPTPSEVIACQRIAMVGVDDIGLRATLKDPRNVNWFMIYLGINPQDLARSLDKFDVVFSNAKYVGIWS